MKEIKYIFINNKRNIHNPRKVKQYRGISRASQIKYRKKHPGAFKANQKKYRKNNIEKKKKIQIRINIRNKKIKTLLLKNKNRILALILN